MTLPYKKSLSRYLKCATEVYSWRVTVDFKSRECWIKIYEGIDHNLKYCISCKYEFNYNKTKNFKLKKKKKKNKEKIKQWEPIILGEISLYSITLKLILGKTIGSCYFLYILKITKMLLLRPKICFLGCVWIGENYLIKEISKGFLLFTSPLP